MLRIRVRINSNTGLAKRQAVLDSDRLCCGGAVQKKDMFRRLLQLDVGCTARGPCFCAGGQHIPR